LKNFLSVNNAGNIDDLIKTALDFKKNPLSNQSLGKGKRIGLLFLNPSMRTRLSTHIAAQNLGMEAVTWIPEADTALVGFVVGGAAARVPVVVDGVIADAALLVAAALAPDVLACCVAGHRSHEPGATAALDHLGLAPLLDLGMRLGEGSGAVLALPIVAAAVRVLHEVATFDSAGVSEK